ncbi:unnamed protein product [Trichogramma brassicae]|uniref:G-protein coupled receptors family 2 profile 2 domain-containing protein n=1 Tax=Trichogramma brassicae TaxID=86971 RepID=A0A6H5IUZ1_9HYME|nr:unnamed protein product [Trichogramma brassicae]
MDNEQFLFRPPLVDALQLIFLYHECESIQVAKSIRDSLVARTTTMSCLCSDSIEQPGKLFQCRCCYCRCRPLHYCPICAARIERKKSRLDLDRARREKIWPLNAESCVTKKVAWKESRQGDTDFHSTSVIREFRVSSSRRISGRASRALYSVFARIIFTDICIVAASRCIEKKTLLAEAKAMAPTVRSGSCGGGGGRRRRVYVRHARSRREKIKKRRRLQKSCRGEKKHVYTNGNVDERQAFERPPTWLADVQPRNPVQPRALVLRSLFAPRPDHLHATVILPRAVCMQQFYIVLCRQGRAFQVRVMDLLQNFFAVSWYPILKLPRFETGQPRKGTGNDTAEILQRIRLGRSAYRRRTCSVPRSSARNTRPDLPQAEIWREAVLVLRTRLTPQPLLSGQLNNTTRSDMEILAYFFGPIGILLAINLLFFAATAHELTCGLWKGEFVKSTTESCSRKSRRADLYTIAARRSWARSSRSDMRRNYDNSMMQARGAQLMLLPLHLPALMRLAQRRQRRLDSWAALGKVCLKLVIVMGVPWIFDVLSWMAGGPDFLWYVTDLCNAAQGVLIFLVVGCQPQVRAALKRLWSRNPRANSNRQGNGLSTTSHGMPSMGDSFTQNPSTNMRVDAVQNDQSSVIISTPRSHYLVLRPGSSHFRATAPITTSVTERETGAVDGSRDNVARWSVSKRPIQLKYGTALPCVSPPSVIVLQGLIGVSFGLWLPAPGPHSLGWSL